MAAKKEEEEATWEALEKFAGLSMDIDAVVKLVLESRAREGASRGPLKYSSQTGGSDAAMLVAREGDAPSQGPSQALPTRLAATQKFGVRYRAFRALKSFKQRPLVSDVVPEDVDRAVYDSVFAQRLRAVLLARARCARDWSTGWLALEDEYEQRRALVLGMLGDWVMDVDLYEGRVAEVKLDARDFIERGEELLLRAPRVRHLHLSGYRGVGPSLFECPLLRGMQSLGLAEQELYDEDIEALVASPHVDNLRWLELSGNHLSQRAFEALASCPTLVRLEYLGLEDNESESPVDYAGTDAMDGSVVSATPTQAGRTLERLAGRTLRWLHAPARFPTNYPPSPLDVGANG